MFVVALHFLFSLSPQLLRAASPHASTAAPAYAAWLDFATSQYGGSARFHSGSEGLVDGTGHCRKVLAKALTVAVYGFTNEPIICRRETDELGALVVGAVGVIGLDGLVDADGVLDVVGAGASSRGAESCGHEMEDITSAPHR